MLLRAKLRSLRKQTLKVVEDADKAHLARLFSDIDRCLKPIELVNVRITSKVAELIGRDPPVAVTLKMNQGTLNRFRDLARVHKLPKGSITKLD